MLWAIHPNCNPPSWVRRSWRPSHLQNYPPRINLLNDTINKMKKGKTGHSDGMVLEMIDALDDCAKEALADLFELRILNLVPNEDARVSKQHTVRLIQKAPGVCRVDKFRSIALLPTFMEIYSGVVLALVGPQIFNLNVENFAFRPGYQTHEVFSIFRLAIEKAREWDMPLCILDGDLQKAYATCEYSLTIAGLREKGIPKILVGSTHARNHGCRNHLHH